MASVCIDRTDRRCRRPSLRCAAAARSVRHPISAAIELEDRRRGGKLRLVGRHAGEPLAHADRIRQLRAAQLREVRLVVEQIELRGRAVLEQVDDALGLGREVRQAGQAAGGLRILRRAATPARRVPMPVLDWLKKCRRVTDSADRWSLLGHHFIQVEQQARHRRVRRQFAAVERWVRARVALAQEGLDFVLLAREIIQMVVQVVAQNLLLRWRGRAAERQAEAIAQARIAIARRLP